MNILLVIIGVDLLWVAMKIICLWASFQRISNYLPQPLLHFSHYSLVFVWIIQEKKIHCKFNNLSRVQNWGSDMNHVFCINVITVSMVGPQYTIIYYDDTVLVWVMHPTPEPDQTVCHWIRTKVIIIGCSYCQSVFNGPYLPLKPWRES